MLVENNSYIHMIKKSGQKVDRTGLAVYVEYFLFYWN